MSEESAGTATPRRRPALILVAIAIVLLAAAAISVFGVLGASRATAQDNDRLALVSAARLDAVDFTTYDYRNIASDFARFAARTTGSLHTDYTRFAPDLETRFKDLKVHSVGQVITAGVVQSTSTTATVLVAVNDTVYNSKTPKGQVVYDRLAFVLQKIDGRWLASSVRPI